VSDNKFSDANSPEKENAVRIALGVEKKFTVDISIPTIGVVHLKQVTIMAISAADAEAKAEEQVLSGEIDAAGEESEEHGHDYDYAPSLEWYYEVNEVNEAD